MEQNETLNAANAHVDGAALLEVGTWLGRHQAFGLIASKCSAADAACLREIRDNKHYRVLGLTWEEFCNRHAGVDHRTADRIVERLEEFGEAYFNLSQLMPIQPSGYRELASSVTANTLELDGRKIPLTPDHVTSLIASWGRFPTKVGQDGILRPIANRPACDDAKASRGRCQSAGDKPFEAVVVEMSS